MNGLDTLAASTGGTARLPAALEAARIDTPEATATDDSLGQDEFLKLMLTQIEHQDPFEPMQNGEFIGQMAQFSTVTGIEGMQSSLDDMASSFGAQQTLEAAALVGDEVLMDGDVIGVDADGGLDVTGLAFALDVPASGLTLTVTDAGGALVARRSLGEHVAGRHALDIDGRGDDGEPLPPGRYTVALTADHGDEQRAIPTQTVHRVASVEFGAGGGAVLNTDGGVSLPLGAVREIRGATDAEALDV